MISKEFSGFSDSFFDIGIFLGITIFFHSIFGANMSFRVFLTLLFFDHYVMFNIHFRDTYPGLSVIARGLNFFSDCKLFLNTTDLSETILYPRAL